MVGPARQGPQRYGRPAHPYTNGPTRAGPPNRSYGQERGNYPPERREGGRRPPPVGREEANELEKPCRRLFIRNCSFETRESEVRELFSQFGEIKNFCDLIARRGICFLTFYDLRGAEGARTALNHSDLRGRNISIHFSLPKEDMQAQSGPCNAEKDQGTLIVTLRNSKMPLEKQSLRSFFERFGQVMNVRDSNDPFKKYVEYYDSRDCIAAFDAVYENGAYQDGRLEVEYGWDDFEKLIRRPNEEYRHGPRSADNGRMGSRGESTSRGYGGPSQQGTEGNLNALLQERLQSLKNQQAWTPPLQQPSGMWPPQTNAPPAQGNVANLLAMLSANQGQSAPMSQMSAAPPTMPNLYGASTGLPPMGGQPSFYPPVANPMMMPSGSTMMPPRPQGNPALTPQQLQQLMSLLTPANPPRQ